MTEYQLYERDTVTGHLKMLAKFLSASDFEAADTAKREARGREVVLYDSQRSIMQFHARSRILVAVK